MPVDMASAERPLGTSMSSVRAEPPNCRRSISAMTCLRTPIWAAIRFANSNSTTCRCPYRKDMAYGSKPSDLAIARVVVESRPPLNRMTALRTPPTLLKRVVQHKREPHASLAQLGGHDSLGIGHVSLR